MKEIYLAGGCFWGVEGYFDLIDGVVETRVGYANGNAGTTMYELLKFTDHAETVYIQYDPTVISLEELLQHYFRVINPWSVNQQGNDIGRQYRTGIYYVDEESHQIAADYLKAFEESHPAEGPVAIELQPLQHFIDAEEYHQDYLKKNPNGYCHIDLNLARVPLD